MVLTLEATGPSAGALGANKLKRFDEQGGTIGESLDNDWVLPDAGSDISRYHAVIESRDGQFYLRDRSTNGTFLGSRSNRLRGQPQVLKSGDVVIIGVYHITVSTADRPVRPAVDNPEFSDNALDSPVERPRAAGPDSDERDPIKLLGFDEPEKGKVPQNRAANLENLVHRQHYEPPLPRHREAPVPSEIIPADYDPQEDVFRASEDAANEQVGKSVPSGAPDPPSNSRPPVDVFPATPPAPGELDVVLRAAGLGGRSSDPDLPETLGRILLAVVSGMMDALRARQQLKDEFRLRTTRFEPRGNNALKFSASPAHALELLLGAPQAAYLGPVEAFEDAFGDLQHHQVAMVAGMRRAFEAMLVEFDPDRLQKEFDEALKSKRTSFLGGGADAKYWDLYRARLHALKGDPESAFRRLFGDHFVEAYESQLDRLADREPGSERR